MSFLEQITSARKSIARIAKHSPWFFPEWGRLKAAEQRLTEAKAEHAAALAAWRRLKGML